MELFDRPVHSTEQLQAGGRDEGLDNPAIILIPSPRDQPAALEAVQQASYIRIATDHAITYVTAWQSFRSTAPKDPQRVVLRWGQAILLEHLRNLAFQSVCGAQYGYKRLLFKNRRVFCPRFAAAGTHLLEV